MAATLRVVLLVFLEDHECMLMEIELKFEEVELDRIRGQQGEDARQERIFCLWAGKERGGRQWW